MNEPSDLEHKLDIVFRDKSLLQRALTHRSYINEHPNFPSRTTSGSSSWATP